MSLRSRVENLAIRTKILVSFAAVLVLLGALGATALIGFGAMTDAVDKINEDAHTAWIIKVELSDTAQVNSLLDAAAYEAFIAEEGGH